MDSNPLLKIVNRPVCTEDRHNQRRPVRPQHDYKTADGYVGSHCWLWYGWLTPLRGVSSALRANASRVTLPETSG